WTEPARGRKEPKHLVSPRSREGMLHHWQQLDMRETQLLDVGDQAVRQLAIRQKAIAFAGDACPRSEMHFIDGHRPIDPSPMRRPAPHPLFVAPLVTGDVADNGR